MEVIKSIIKEFLDYLEKLLALIPVDQKIIGYVLIGLGALVILIVLISFIAKLFKKNPSVSYQSKLQGARLSGPLTNMPPNFSSNQKSNLNPNFNQATSPIRGNFAPKPIVNVGTEPKEFGLSKLRSQVENVNEQSAPVNFPETRATIPNISESTNFQNFPGSQNPSPVQKPVYTSYVSPIKQASTGMARGAGAFSQNTPPVGFSTPAKAQMPNIVINQKPIDPNLLDYIKKTKSLGYPNSAIRSELIKVGWNPIDIDQALSQG